MLLAAVVALTLASVWLSVRFSAWNNAFYDALQNHDRAAFWHQFGTFGVLAGLFSSPRCIDSTCIKSS